jgi:signal transduction histidine kinase
MFRAITLRQTGKAAAIWVAIIAGLYLTWASNYLLFHSLVEIFTILVAAAIFMLLWNSRSVLENNYLLFLGIGLVYVAFIDMLHTLAYTGMGVFSITSNPNLTYQLWIAGRFLEGVSLLIAPFLLKRKYNVYTALAAYGGATSILLVSIFVWRNFPSAYLEGLTPFRRESEIIIILIMLASMAALRWQRRAFAADVWRMLEAAILALSFGELSIELNTDSGSLFSFIGHVSRVVAYYLLYKAVIECGFDRPYRMLYLSIKHSEETLQAQSKELTVRNEELDAFAHTVAHDLQNPLTTIALASQVALRPDMTDGDRNELLQEIAETSHAMSSIIEELILLAETSSEKAPLETLDMSEIVSVVQQRLARQIKESQAKVRVQKTWPEATGYAPWVEEVWANYLGNALKYGGKPPVIELGAETQGDGQVRYWVRDHGPGLSDEEQAHLFQPFTRLRTVKGGHGLGLSIVRRVVEKLGGQVGVKSQPGEGAEFYFTLPADGVVVK